MSLRSGDRGREVMAPPLHDRSILHIKRMWERRLGLETGILDFSGTIFREWSGFTSVVALRLDDALVVSGPDEALRELKALPLAELLDASSVIDALGAMSPTLFGRALIGYADASSFSPTDGTARARGAALIDVEQALSTCGAEERGDAETRRGLTYRTRRIGRADARSALTVRALGPLFAEPGGPEDRIATSLTARWAFHQQHLGRTLHCRNHHEPWPLQQAELVSLDDQLLRAAGFGELAERPPDSVLYASAVSTGFAAPSRV